jgi:RND family efflux transporter MFP subunit
MLRSRFRSGKSRWATSIVVLLLAAGVAYAWRALTPHPTATRVSTGTATRGEFVISLMTDGTLQSEDTVVVRTGKAPGQLTSIATDGTLLRKGDVFCHIEARDLLRKQADAQLAYKQAIEDIQQTREDAEQRRDQAQRSLVQAEKDFQVWEESTGMRIKQTQDQLTFDKAEAERLRLDYERSDRMAAKGYVAGSEAELAKAAYDSQQFKVKQSEKDLALNQQQIDSERRQRQSSVDSARRRTDIWSSRIQDRVDHAVRRAEVAKKQLDTIATSLDDTIIRAPADGTVSLFTTWRGGERRPWREGDQVESGTPLASISGSQNMSVLCRIKETDIALVHEGQQAELEFQALVGKTYAGEISSVGTVAREVWVWEDPTATANERVFDVVVRVKESRPGGLKPGLSARVRITVKRIPDTVSVPLDGVFERSGKSYVFVKQGDAFVRKEVQTGERNDLAVQVKSGLSGGEVVALADPTRYPSKPPEKKQ